MESSSCGFSKQMSLLKISDEMSLDNSGEWGECTVVNTRQWYPVNTLSVQDSNGKSEVTKTENSSKIRSKNDFRFGFNIRYDHIIEKFLYPSLFKKFIIDGYLVIQKAGANRMVCLVCQCDLAFRSKYSAIYHLSGAKHLEKLSMPFIIELLKSYHDTFLNLEPEFQAHQVYFSPYVKKQYLKCILCTLYVEKHNIISHILNEPHKSNVLILHKDPDAEISFSLTDKHLLVYGIKNENKVVIKKTPNEVKKPRDRKIRENVHQHVIVKSVEIADSPILMKSLPRRFHGHCELLKVDEGSSVISCICCGMDNIQKEQLIQHLIQPTHFESAKLSLSISYYYCEICNHKMYDEWEWVMHFRNKPLKHNTIDPSRKDLVEEHECLTCNSVIFGDNLSLMQHQGKRIKRTEKVTCELLYGKNVSSRHLPKPVEQYFKSKISIRLKGKMLLEEAEDVRNSKTVLSNCCEDLENSLRYSFPFCKAYPFGSRISGLGSKKSDLDVFIDIGDNYNGDQNQEFQLQFSILTSACTLFKKNKKFGRITSRPTARTPIIKLKHIPAQIDFDISFRHGLSVENTKFLRFCFELQPIAQELVLLLKKWLNLCGFHERITTYALAMMAIFYLQTQNYLITVKKLREINPQSNLIIIGCETIPYTTPLEEIKKHIEVFKGDIVDLLKGFFYYYSWFNFRKKVICPLLGEAILKSHFTDDVKGRKLPPEMASYIRKINEEEDAEFFRISSGVCIQDPFDLSHNLTKALGCKEFKKFETLIYLTYNFLDKLE